MSNDISELFNEFLFEAENIFGENNNDWIFGGIEFYDCQPHLRYYPESGYVTISLSNKAKDDQLQRVFQLSHEVCHLLHPSRDYPSLFLNETLTINEGISTYFSIYKSGYFFNNKAELIENLKINSNDYYNAYLLVEELINTEPDLIKKLRLQKKKIDKIVAEDFDNLSVNISDKLKEDLLKPFKQNIP